MINEEKIKAMSYTDFIGFINQWNVLPGSYVTLSKFVKFANIDSKSNVLELACTSGFSLREISLMTSCSGTGLDISEASVQMAKYNKEKYAPNSNIDYLVENADEFENKSKFTHVVVGAALKFFDNPEKTIERIVNNYLEDGGYLLASPFYVNRDIPLNLVEKAKKVFGITITTTNYKETMRLYKNLEIVYEDRNIIEMETEEELEHYCNSTIDRALDFHKITDEVVKKTMYDRLMEIKNMSNELRPYQNYSTLILKYRKNIYPNRFTEIF
jgi:SAM-dependent methyltransferase